MACLDSNMSTVNSGINVDARLCAILQNDFCKDDSAHQLIEYLGLIDCYARNRLGGVATFNTLYGLHAIIQF